MLRREFRMFVDKLRCRFTDHDDVQDDGLLGFPVGQKVGLREPFDVAARELDRLQHVVEIVGIAQLTPLGSHTGTASRRTRSRNLTGRSPGVSTSTATPRTCSSSI